MVLVFSKWAKILDLVLNQKGGRRIYGVRHNCTAQTTRGPAVTKLQRSMFDASRLGCAVVPDTVYLVTSAGKEFFSSARSGAIDS